MATIGKLECDGDTMYMNFNYEGTGTKYLFAFSLLNFDLHQGDAFTDDIGNGIYENSKIGENLWMRTMRAGDPTESDSNYSTSEWTHLIFGCVKYKNDNLSTKFFEKHSFLNTKMAGQY